MSIRQQKKRSVTLWVRGAVGGHYDVNVERVNHHVETSQLVDVEMKQYE